jgi:hypothetical protein
MPSSVALDVAKSCLIFLKLRKCYENSSLICILDYLPTDIRIIVLLHDYRSPIHPISFKITQANYRHIHITILYTSVFTLEFIGIHIYSY